MRRRIATATYLVPGLVITFALGACEAGPPDAVTGVGSPESALAAQDVAASSHGPAATRTTVEMDVVTHNVCTGEWVHVQGPVHFLFRSQSDQAGGFILGVTRDHREVTGTGLTSGDTYRVQGVHTFQAHVKPPFPLALNEQFRLVLVGPAGTALVHGSDRFVIDANGVIRVDEIQGGTYSCPGPEG